MLQFLKYYSRISFWFINFCNLEKNALRTDASTDASTNLKRRQSSHPHWAPLHRQKVDDFLVSHPQYWALLWQRLFQPSPKIRTPEKTERANWLNQNTKHAQQIPAWCSKSKVAHGQKHENDISISAIYLIKCVLSLFQQKHWAKLNNLRSSRMHMVNERDNGICGAHGNRKERSSMKSK